MNNKPWFQNPREAQSATPSSSSRVQGAASPVNQPTSATASMPSGTTAPAHAPHNPTPVQAPVTPAGAAQDPMPSQLIVGPKIRLNGAEIEQCDILVIEGHVKATVKSRTLRISATGTLDGDADIELAEIEGTFAGTLNASTRLVIKATGRVTGTIRYGKLVVEDGGELGGDVRPIGEGTAARGGATPARKEASREGSARDGLLSSPVPA